MRPPSRRSTVLAAVLARTIRPLADRSNPSGAQLRVMRAVVDGVGGRRARLRRADPALPGRWVRAAGVTESAAAVLYLHGGGYVVGSPRSHHRLAYRLSAATGVPVFVADYRRAPEHTFPAAADDALAAYRAMLESFPAGRIALAADSVGGHLAASVLVDVARLDLARPAAVALFSPALDFTAARTVELDRLTRDPFLSPSYGLRCAAAYFADTPREDPRVSVFDADLAGWPPALIQVGGTECLRGDAAALADALGAVNVPCELQIWPGQVHVFHGFGWIPEARAAVRYAGEWLRTHLTPTSEESRRA